MFAINNLNILYIMRNFYKVLLVLLVFGFAASCSSDDDAVVENNLFPHQSYTKDMFIGEWEGYAEKEIVVNPMGNISINEGAVNNPWETMECYRFDMVFDNTKLTETWNEWSDEQGKYSCNIQVSFNDNWIYEDGENKFIQYTKNEDDTIDEYILYVHFLENGDLLTWYDNYYGTKVANFFKKK